MADADQSLEILIKSVLDATGYRMNEAEAQKLKAGLGNLANTTQDAAKGAEKLEINHRALHQVLHLIGHESGPEAEAALATLATAGTGSIVLLVLAARALFDWLEKIKQKQEEIREQNAEIWIQQRDAIQAASDAADAYQQNLAKAALKTDDLKIAFAGANAELAAQIDGHKKILDAIEKEQLAEAKGDKEKEAAIKQRFEDLKRQYDITAEQKKLDQDRQQLAGLKQQQEKLSAIAQDQEAEKERIIADREASAAKARMEGKDEKKLKAAAQPFLDVISQAISDNITLLRAGTQLGLGRSASPQEYLGAIGAGKLPDIVGPAGRAAVNAFQAYEDDAKAVHDHDEAVKRATDKASEAEKARDANTEAIKAQTAKVNSEQSVFDVHRRTAATEQGIGGLTRFAATGNIDDVLRGLNESDKAMANFHDAMSKHLLDHARTLNELVHMLEQLGITINQELRSRIDRALQ